VTETNGDLVICRDGQPIARMPKDGYYFDRLAVYPGGAHLPVEEFKPPRFDQNYWEHYRLQSRALHENTDLAIVAPMGPAYELFFGMGTGGFTTWMVAMVEEPEYVHAMCGKLVDVWLKNLERFAEAVDKRVQIIQLNDDFGTQHAPFISVEMFRDLFLPHYRRGLDWIHEHTDMKVMLHSDGAIYPLIPSLIEMGVDILNPVQTTARGMDAQRLKNEFGDRLVFWGGSLNCQETLPFGTAEEVAREVTEHVSVFAPGGGYVFAPVHNIQAKVPPENVLAMFETAREWKYPWCRNQ
jgi:uroporphyrinogen decarboxylase